MSDVEHAAADRKSLRKLRDKMRFNWFEELIMTEIGIQANVVRYAAWIMIDRKFKLSHLGLVELSTRKAAKQLHVHQRTVQRANDWLVRRNWLVPIPRQGCETQRYRLSEGPTLRWLLRGGNATHGASPPRHTVRHSPKWKKSGQ
jgi:hypothetical protein